MCDIGNLDTLQLIEGKPPTNITRPITRGFCAKLLANAQAAALENKNSVVAAVGDGLPVNGKGGNVKKVAKANKKLSDKPNLDTTIANSSDDEEMVKKKGGKQASNDPKPESAILINSNDEANVNPVSEKSSHQRSFRKNIKTLQFLVLKAGLLVLCSKSPQKMIPKSRISSGHSHSNVRMRKILVDWLIQVHNSFQLMPESLYLTINILDRYLSKKVVSRYELQLVGLGAMLIACKYEELWPPRVKDLVCISDNAYVEEQVLAMEKAILGTLEWYLTVPTAYVFLVRYIKASVSPDMEMEYMVFFLAELGIVYYNTVVLYPPSMIAAGAVYAARCTLNRSPFWSETLKHHTGYSGTTNKLCKAFGCFSPDGCKRGACGDLFKICKSR
ncbi:Cyclin B1, putative [Theobroma cacao]|uniref:Cyclin B1, putative n=1 Tax=Theobroma cacao TaxID=3641 RepID=A0A061GTQ9_THECC|nr:Cyclin B1, putative [Theobroma cacao]